MTTAAMICFFTGGPEAVLRYPLVLLLIVCAGGGIWIAVESIAILIQYGWRNKDNE
jgi:hypothetical protein